MTKNTYIMNNELIIGSAKRAIEMGYNIASNVIPKLKEGDNIFYPDTYINIVGKSDQLNTPLGDKYMILSYPYNYEYQQGMIPTGIRPRTEQFVTTPTTLPSKQKTITIEAPIINVTRKKTVISTSVYGLDSSIFQTTSNGDYNITASFSFISDKIWERKRDDFNDFLSVMNRQTDIDIVNPFLNDNYNINKIIIESFTVTPDSNYSNIINVNLNMKYVAGYKIFDKYISDGSLTLQKYK